MSRNPAAILYDGYGEPLAKIESDVIFSDQPGVVFAGKDDDGLIRFISLSNTGVIKTTPNERNIVGEYYAGTDLIAGSDTIQNLISLENPVVSDTNLFLSGISVGGVAVSNFTTPFLYYVTRTIGLPTDGIVLVSQKRSTSDAPPEGIVKTSPVVVSDLGALWVGSPGQVSVGISNINVFESLNSDLEKNEIVIAPGEAILIWAEENSNDWTHWINLRWNEVLI